MGKNEGLRNGNDWGNEGRGNGGRDVRGRSEEWERVKAAFTKHAFCQLTEDEGGLKRQKREVVGQGLTTVTLRQLMREGVERAAESAPG